MGMHHMYQDRTAARRTRRDQTHTKAQKEKHVEESEQARQVQIEPITYLQDLRIRNPPSPNAKTKRARKHNSRTATRLTALPGKQSKKTEHTTHTICGKVGYVKWHIEKQVCKCTNNECAKEQTVRKNLINRWADCVKMRGYRYPVTRYYFHTVAKNTPS